MYVTIPGEATPVGHAVSWRSPQRSNTERRLKAGSNLFFEGDDVRRLYLVKSGVLRLSRLLEDGRRQVIAFGYPGDIVGFPCNGLHHTDCDTLTDTHLQSFGRAALEDGDGDPELHRELLQAALQEIGQMQDHFMMLGRKSAVEKVASFLLNLANRVGRKTGVETRFTLPMSRKDIADFLGLTTETVSRTFTQLRNRRLLHLEDAHNVVVPRLDALEDLARGDQAE